MRKDRKEQFSLGRNLERIGDQFELGLLESSLIFNPESVDIMVSLGSLYTRLGKYMKGLKVDRKLVSMIPENPVFHYNLACSYSLLRRIESAIKALSLAVELGFDDKHLIESDEDLNNLRQDERFQDILHRLEII